MEVGFTGTVFQWRGPSPFYFVDVGEEAADAIGTVAASVTYGWGVIPVTARIGATAWTTSLFPRDGSYLLGLKDAVRRAEGVTDGAVVSVTLRLEV
ncbi:MULTISPECIES: DUF1905 domain-containing protein [Desertihabitans]|uniref:DUF1905 domain-containing protein n=1 Tax=Desertihabitans brevis TaxID=2268447 RepID=A0A367YYX1_9ACTN|nr:MULTISPECIES: DUF1905 domain-containing protein [Desertihabitans]RCK71113.1 DUF1905 domain-containing protein [Desertihabitans brevis]